MCITRLLRQHSKNKHFDVQCQDEKLRPDPWKRFEKDLQIQ
jgi:hypothetical protein